MAFNKDVLKIDPAVETEKIADFVVEHTRNTFRRRGVVVGLSGGVDSAVMGSLAVEAVGKENVLGLVMPEQESNPVSSSYAEAHAKALDIETKKVDLTTAVDAVGSYERRDEFIKSLVPEYTADCKYNIRLPTDLLERSALNFYTLCVELPDGTLKKKRLDPKAFRALTSFANIKIRSRMIRLYFEAETRSMVVAGTTNRTEFLLGDFCKFGDGGTDLEPLSHLYKDQIYQLAEYLDVTEDIRRRTPSPDTFSLPVSDQEFFFRIPFDKLDLLLYAWEHEIPTAETAITTELDEEAVKRAFADFTSKYRATQHLRDLPYSLPFTQ
jgi:NAD+ synthase